jgi:exosortase A-associated hydrolase 1
VLGSLTIDTDDNTLSAIYHPGDAAAKFAVLIIVGGPQYRVGSHRHFVALARQLAGNGIPTLRFDAAGMGDSDGKNGDFERLDGNIHAAIDLLMAQSTSLQGVVLWGLCDGASAALLYAPTDRRVDAVVMVNPWLENDQAQAHSQLWGYYLKRLCSLGLWKKLLTGNVNLSRGVGELGSTMSAVVQTSDAVTRPVDSYQQRMLSAMQRLDCPMLLLLSGEDLTAAEFERQFYNHTPWQRAQRGKQILVQRHAQADHTFSTRAWKHWAATVSADFVRSID